MNNLLYAWSQIYSNHKNILVRIPHTEDFKRLLKNVQMNNKSVLCLGIPEPFKDYDECQYLIRGKKVWVKILTKKLSDMVENQEYIIYTPKSGIKQYEVKLSLWYDEIYSDEKFPFVAKYWKLKRPDNFKKYNRQLKLPFLKKEYV